MTAVKQNVGGEYGGGTLQLTLTVKEPRRPMKPSPPYDCINRGDNPTWKPRPVPPKRKANETDDAYANRSAPQLTAQASYDGAMRRYREEVARYEVEFPAYRGAIEDYMWLTGSAGIIGAKSVMVSLEPLNRGFAEMEALLLPPPTDVTPEGVPSDAEIEAALTEGLDDAPCPQCAHPVSGHEDGELGGCSVLIGGDAEELCPCERGAA